MCSGNDNRNDLQKTLFSIVVIASLLPFVLILESDSPGLIGIPCSHSPVLDYSVWIFCNGGTP